MRYTISILIFFGHLHLICQTRQSFEGKITYKISIELKDNIPTEYSTILRDKFGDTMVSYHSSIGTIKRVFLNTASDGYGYDYQIYSHKENRFYSKDRAKDTLYYFNATFNSIKLKNVETQSNYSDIILDQPVKSIIYTGISLADSQLVTITYKYSGTPYINPKLYLQWKDFFTNEFFQESKSPYLEYILDTQIFTIKVQAIDIKEQDVDNTIFHVPNTLYVKEVNPLEK